MAHFFVIHRNKSLSALPMAPSASKKLAEDITRLREEFFNESAAVDYDPGYTPNKCQFFKMLYTLPDTLGDNLVSQDKYLKPVEDSALVNQETIALVSVIESNAGMAQMCFQSINSGNMLRSKSVIIFDDVFDFNKKSGIVLSNKIHAIFEDGELFFRSPFTVAKFLELKDFFVEADNETITKLFSQSHFVVSDISNILGNVNSITRRKITAIYKKDFKFDSDRAKIAIDKLKLPLTLEGGSLVIPSDKKGLEIAINLLNDDIFQSSWDDNIGYVTDNKTTLKKSGKSV